MKVGFTASCFDLFHAGHVLMLHDAKRVCEYLIVAIQTDPSIDRPEKNKPVQSMFERFTQVQACRYVDQIVVYDTESDLLNILKSYKIDVRIIGEEYKGREFTGHDLPMEFYFNPRKHTFSTTELRQRIKEATNVRSILSE